MKQIGIKDINGIDICEGDTVELIFPKRDDTAFFNRTLKEKVTYIPELACYSLTTWLMHNQLGKNLQDKEKMNVKFKII